MRDKLAEHPTYRRLRSLFGPAPYPHICRSHHDTPVELGSAPSPSDLPSKRGGTQAIGLDVRGKKAPDSADLWRAQRVHWLPDLVVRPGGEFDLPPNFPPERLVVRIQADPGLDELREGVRLGDLMRGSSLRSCSTRAGTMLRPPRRCRSCRTGSRCCLPGSIASLRADSSISTLACPSCLATPSAMRYVMAVVFWRRRFYSTISGTLCLHDNVR